MTAPETWTLILPEGPVEIQAADIIEALRIARHQLQTRDTYGTFPLVNDQTGTANHVQRYAP